MYRFCAKDYMLFPSSNYNTRMAPPDRTEFPAGQDTCRAARERCARACREYNAQAEVVPADERCALYIAIVNASAFDEHKNLRPSGIDKEIRERTVVDDAAIVEPPSVAAALTSSSTSNARGTDPCLGSSPDPAAAACPSQINNCSTSPNYNRPMPTTGTPVTPYLSVSQSCNDDDDDDDDGQRFPGQALAPYIKPPLYMDYGINVKIGRSTFINRNCKILDTPVRYIRIGERCLIGPDFSVYAVAHPVEFEHRCKPAGVPSYGLDVTIGNDVWIGGHVTILGGVSIGDGSVIGANSLITKDIPAYHLAFGSPARVVRQIGGSTHRAFPFAWALPEAIRFRTSRLFRSRTILGRLQLQLTSLALGASICTAVAAFVYLQSSAAT